LLVEAIDNGELLLELGEFGVPAVGSAVLSVPPYARRFFDEVSPELAEQVQVPLPTLDRKAFPLRTFVEGSSADLAVDDAARSLAQKWVHACQRSLEQFPDQLLATVTERTDPLEQFLAAWSVLVPLQEYLRRSGANVCYYVAPPSLLVESGRLEEGVFILSAEGRLDQRQFHDLLFYVAGLWGTFGAMEAAEAAAAQERRRADQAALLVEVKKELAFQRQSAAMARQWSATLGHEVADFVETAILLLGTTDHPDELPKRASRELIRQAMKYMVVVMDSKATRARHESPWSEGQDEGCLVASYLREVADHAWRIALVRSLKNALADSSWVIDNAARLLGLLLEKDGKGRQQLGRAPSEVVDIAAASGLRFLPYSETGFPVGAQETVASRLYRLNVAVVHNAFSHLIRMWGSKRDLSTWEQVKSDRKKPLGLLQLRVGDPEMPNQQLAESERQRSLSIVNMAPKPKRSWFETNMSNLDERGRLPLDKGTGLVMHQEASTQDLQGEVTHWGPMEDPREVEAYFPTRSGEFLWRARIVFPGKTLIAEDK